MRNDEFNKRLARFLKQIRKDKGYTVPEVAKSIGRSADSIYCYEEGTRTLPFELIVQLSEFYEVSIDDLINSRVTCGRAKAISFDCYRKNGKTRVLIDAQNDDVVLYEADEWNTRYYEKCMNVVFNKEMLIQYKKRVMPARISFDESTKAYLVYDLENECSMLIKNKRFSKDVIVLGSYAGVIQKQMKLPNFLD